MLAILLLPNLSDGQVITVIDPKGVPVNQAVVVINTFKGSNKQIGITDNSGKVKMVAVLKKVQVMVSHLSFENHVDTLDNLNADIKITLVSKKVALDEVVVTSEYSPRTISESVHAVTVISKTQIENQAAPDLESLLSQQLSMRVSQDAVLGSGLTMNGLTGQNIKFLIDGVPVIGRLDGNVDLGQMNLSNVERVEIVNGPMAASYGTDAAGGVINMITKQVTDKKYDAGANFMYESVGKYNMDAFAGFSKGRSALLVSGGRNFFDGWSVADTGRWQEWKPKEQYFGNVKYRFQLKKLVLSYQVNGFYEKISNKGNPRLSPYFAYAFDEYYKTLRISNQLNGSLIINSNWTTSGTVSHSLYHRAKNTYRKDLVSLNEILIPDQASFDSTNANSFIGRQDTTIMNSWMGRMVFNRQNNKNLLNFQFGIDLMVENANGTRFIDQEIQTGDYAIFASAEYQATKKLEIKPAVRFSYNTDFNAPVVPSLMLKYNFPKNIQARVSYGKGFRAPGIKERYLYFVDINHDIRGNENLQPENSDNFFLSINKKIIIGSTTHNLQLSGFYNNIKNLITLAQPDASESLFTYVNIGTFSTYGGTLLNSVNWKNFILSAGAGVTSRYNIYADSGHFKKYFYSVDLNANVQYQFKKLNLTAAVYFKYNGKLPGYNLNADNTITQFSNDSYRFLDASIRKGLFKQKLIVGTGIKNILNVTNVNAFTQGSAHNSAGDEQAVGTGRAYFIRVQYQLGK